MPSNSLSKWQGERTAALQEIETAHAVVGGTARGRRYATQQINYAYTALLASQFQGFCRDLHTECVEHIVVATPPALLTLLRVEFLWNRTIDKGNARAGGLGSDFGRLGAKLWPDVNALDARNAQRQAQLENMLDWRNAIAHQDFGPVGGTTLRLAQVRRWRSAITGLAHDFDRALHQHLTLTLGNPPW